MHDGCQPRGALFDFALSLDVRWTWNENSQLNAAQLRFSVGAKCRNFDAVPIGRHCLHARAERGSTRMSSATFRLMARRVLQTWQMQLV